MDLKFSNLYGSLVILVLLISLITFIYGGLSDHYGFTPSDLDSDGNNVVMSMQDKLEEVNVIAGINSFIEGVTQLTSGNTFDLLGGLKMVGIGILQGLFGLLTAPAEIIGVVTDFYYLPPNVARLIQLMLTLAIAFMVIRYYIGDET